MYANRKLRSSKLFCRSEPPYTPYHMVAESRPLYLLIRLIKTPQTPRRLQRRYQAHPLLQFMSGVFGVFRSITFSHPKIVVQRCFPDLQWSLILQVLQHFLIGLYLVVLIFNVDIILSMYSITGVARLFNFTS